MVNSNYVEVISRGLNIKNLTPILTSSKTITTVTKRNNECTEKQAAASEHLCPIEYQSVTSRKFHF